MARKKRWNDRSERCAETERSKKRASYETVAAYACSKRKNLGSYACENSLRRPVESIDAAVLGWIRDNVLTERMLVQTLGSLRQTLENRAQNVDTELEAQVRNVKAELERLTNALLVSEDKPELVMHMISEREKRLTALNARLINTRTSPSVAEQELSNVEESARERQNELRGVFAQNPEEARDASALQFTNTMGCVPASDVCPAKPAPGMRTSAPHRTIHAIHLASIGILPIVTAD